MDRLERLINLVVALLDTSHPLTREQLRERVGGYNEGEDNFRRNFERDKERLRQIGIPIVSTPLDPANPEGPVGYRVPRSLYELPDPGLDAEELAALGAAASAVAFEGAGETPGATALWKLAAAAPDSSASPGLAAWVPTGPGGPRHPGAPTGPATRAVEPLIGVPLGPQMAVLFKAVTERLRVHFTYNGLARRVDPYRLSFRQGHWYLAGYDHTRESERLFRVDRLTGEVGIVGAPGAFTPPAQVAAGPPPPWQLGDDDEVVVRLRVDAVHADQAAAAAGQPRGARTATGDSPVELSFAVRNWPAFRTFVLGFLDHAEVLGPPEARDQMVEWLEELA